MTKFKVWSYRCFSDRKATRYRRKDEMPMLTMWAYALSHDDGGSYEISKAKSGFVTEQEATSAALRACA